jgi:hypothetical protein
MDYRSRTSLTMAATPGEQLAQELASKQRAQEPQRESDCF